VDVIRNTPYFKLPSHFLFLLSLFFEKEGKRIIKMFFEKELLKSHYTYFIFTKI